MVRMLRLKASLAAMGASILACIGVGGTGPHGGYEIVSMKVMPADGDPQEVFEAGRLELGGTGNVSEDDRYYCTDTADTINCSGDAIAIIAYHWEGGALVPLWAPERVLFVEPEWNSENDRWLGPMPIGNLSCTFVRESKGPLVLTGACEGPDGSVDIELVMDR